MLIRGEIRCVCTKSEKHIPSHKDDSGTPNVFWRLLARVHQRHDDPCGPSSDSYVPVGQPVHEIPLLAITVVTRSVVGANNVFDSRTASVYDV